MKRLITLFGFGALLSVAASACVYDPDDRCGEHQRFESDRCWCEPGFVPGDAGCVPCGELEMEVNGSCVCLDGYARPSEGAACEAIPTALGEPCDSAGQGCSDERYPLCHLTSDSEGYCTSACSSEEPACDGGYKCQDEGAGSYCRRPPLGYGKSCETSADCAGGEASYCETLQSHVCIVPCQAGMTDVCFVGEVCCDFVLFEPVCVPTSACDANGTEVK